MNWEIAGVLAEGISAAAVIITLAYVSVQIRLSREVSQVESSYTTVQIYANWRSHLIENQEVATIVAKANRGEALTDAEDIRLATLMDDLFIATAISHVGGVTADVFYDSSGEVNYVERIFRQNPGLAPYWASSREFIATGVPAFAELVDSRLQGKSFPLEGAEP